MAQVHMVADAKAKEEFVLPVSWQVYSRIKVQASSLEEAYKWAEEHLDEIPLGDDTDYIDGSYELGGLEECELLNEKLSSEKVAHNGQYRAVNIQWDLDEGDMSPWEMKVYAEAINLPDVVIIPDEIAHYESDNKYHYTIEGYAEMS